jgi:regulatory protein
VRSRPRKNRPDPAGRGRAAPAAGAGGAADPRALGVAAATLLARRDYSRSELQSRLLERGFDATAVAALLEELIEQRVIDDTRYAERFVAFHAGRGHGPARIRRELVGLGVAEELIRTALDAGPDWGMLAREQRARKFGSRLPAAWSEKARQARFLQYRGFSTDHIRSALGADDLDLDS